MEFQVYAVCLEDRYPLATNARRDELLCEQLPRGVTIEKTIEGCVAFVFGRAEDGRSVCVRIEGVKPRLFFACEDVTTPTSSAPSLGDVRRVLEKGIDLRDATGIEVAMRTFCHYYDYEPDASTASKRRTHRYYEASYPSLATWRQAKQSPLAHEQEIDPLTRFCFEYRITPGAWIRAPVNEVAWRVTTCDVELEATSVEPVVGREDSAPYVRLFYDIETLGLDPNDKPVIQIGMVFKSLHSPACEKHLLAIGSVDPIPDVTVHACPDEGKLLRTFRRLVVEKDPDFLIAYNGVNFDNNYLDRRAQMHDVDEFWRMSRFAYRKSPLRELSLSSAGMGDNLLRYFDLPGRATFDWFVKLKRDLTSEPSYSLNHFARKFCGSQKDDMSYKEIPILQAGTSADRARLGAYCVQDCALLWELDEKRTLTLEILQFSIIMGILPEWVYFRGQQKRFMTKLLEKSRTAESLPLLLNNPKRGFSGVGEQSFQGATVNDALRKYYKDPVGVVDWKSLYPSIMMAHNLCHSTLVRDPALFDAPGVVAHAIGDGVVHHFTTAHKGIMPTILEELLAQRGRAKKRMKQFARAARDATTDEERARCELMYKVCDGQQLALKVSCNSMYGACGAVEMGKYPCLAISATVTREGREAMVIKKDVLSRHFPGIVFVYGDTDSLFLLFPDAHDVSTCQARCEEAADVVNRHFLHALHLEHMELEFEKIYFPFVIYDKKIYMGIKYEPEGEGMVSKGIDAKGMETERRDKLPFVKDILYDLRDALMVHLDERLALQRFREKMELLMRNEVPMEKFIVKKNLTSKVVDKTDTIAQARVNALRKEREAGSEEAVGGQVEMVYVEGHKNAKATELVEDPTYAKEHKLKLNRLFYLEHHIETPVRKFFSVLDDGINIEEELHRVRSRLDAQRLGVNDGMRRFLTNAASSSASSSSTTTTTASVVRIPKPPPPIKKKKKNKKDTA